MNITKKRRIWRNNSQKRNYEKNRQKIKARSILNMAVRDKKIYRLPCIVNTCGAIPAEGHHLDYSLPLAVLWLCRSHHLQLHKSHKQI